MGRQPTPSPQRSDEANALYDRGNALQRARRFAEAVASYDQALAIRPDWIEALTNRGAALRALNRPEEALASYDRAIAVRPTYTLALVNRGNVLRDLGRHHQALASYEQALALQPLNPDALNNRGICFRDLGQHAESLESYDRSLAFFPDNVNVLVNRASALIALGRPSEALESCGRALALRPGLPEAFNVRGNALCKLGRPGDALADYEQASAARPDDAGILYNRGNVLQMLGRHQDSLADYDRALKLKPDYADALYNRGNALLTLRRNRAAAEDFERLLKIDPEYPYAAGKLLHARMRCCDWTEYQVQTKQISLGVAAGKRCAMPFEFTVASDRAEDQLRCAQTWIADNAPSSARPLWQGERYRHDRIRLAYLSADFHEHATAYLMAGLFEQHDRRRFETIAVSYGPDDQSPMRQRLQSAFDRFIDVRDNSEAEIAALLRTLEVDIAVDLKGFTGESRPAILASRPAPVQVNYLGYPGTMGAPYIDYILADRFLIPEDQRQSYSECVVALPDSYAPNDPKRRIATRMPARAEVGLPAVGFVFCSFNNSYKITPDIFDIWMRLLHRVDGSVLWLLSTDPSADDNLRREAEVRGVRADRLVFAPRIKLEDHLARHRLADLFLDTRPCNAHTTASDALWAGLPLVTCPGSTFAGRVAGSLLNAIGLPELVACSLTDYEALALRLALDKDALAAIKATLAQNRDTHPLFDLDRSRNHIEAAYVAMWERSKAGEPPASFAVEPATDRR